MLRGGNRGEVPCGVDGVRTCLRRSPQVTGGSNQPISLGTKGGTCMPLADAAGRLDDLSETSFAEGGVRMAARAGRMERVQWVVVL
jgi:hypothetical protein